MMWSLPPWKNAKRCFAFHLVAATAAIAIGLLLALCSRVVAQTPFPTNNDPARQIRFNTPADAVAKRNQLISFIWKDGLPATLPALTPNVALPSQAVDIDAAHVARVDRLEANVSGWDFRALAYLIHPKNAINEKRVVIVHHGHADTLDAGVGLTANHLLQLGFTVVVMEMPLHGWNTDKTAEIPGRGTFIYADHGQMISQTADDEDGQGFRLFIEPVVQTINYIVAKTPDLKDISMVGLSGGGWTTSVMAAIDPRIRFSVPIAGSAPLYQRNADASSVGDLEQYFLPLFREDIAADGSGGGVATWLEIYALGGFGKNRRQVYVNNEFDSCCFSGQFADRFKTIVSDRVKLLGDGQWENFVDSAHHGHVISEQVIAKVIDPLLGIKEVSQTPSGLPIVDDFSDQQQEFPGDWKLDPQSIADAKAVESNNRVTISGAGLSAIVRKVPFNPQAGHPITITMKIASLSADNMAGVFITDVAGTRPHQLGVLLNAAARDVALNADNGKGFDANRDRLVVGKLFDFTGGPATIALTFDAKGFSVSVDAGAAGRCDSGPQLWSQVPDGFDLTNFGDQAYLFIQSFDLDGGTPASIVVDSISVR